MTVVARQEYVRLAQLDRAFGYGPKGREFESSNAHKNLVNFRVYEVFYIGLNGKRMRNSIVVFYFFKLHKNICSVIIQSYKEKCKKQKKREIIFNNLKNIQTNKSTGGVNEATHISLH